MDGARQVAVCERCRVADNPFTRMRGLLGRSELPAAHGLLVKPAPAVHTFFMRFPIDVVFLDRDFVVVGVEPDLRPWKFAGRRGAHAALELRAGRAEELGIREHDRLAVTDTEDLDGSLAA